MTSVTFVDVNNVCEWSALWAALSNTCHLHNSIVVFVNSRSCESHEVNHVAHEEWIGNVSQQCAENAASHKMGLMKPPLKGGSKNLI